MIIFLTGVVVGIVSLAGLASIGNDKEIVEKLDEYDDRDIHYDNDMPFTESTLEDFVAYPDHDFSDLDFNDKD